MQQLLKPPPAPALLTKGSCDSNAAEQGGVPSDDAQKNAGAAATLVSHPLSEHGSPEKSEPSDVASIASMEGAGAAGNAAILADKGGRRPDEAQPPEADHPATAANAPPPASVKEDLADLWMLFDQWSTGEVVLDDGSADDADLLASIDMSGLSDLSATGAEGSTEEDAASDGTHKTSLDCMAGGCRRGPAGRARRGGGRATKGLAQEEPGRHPGGGPPDAQPAAHAPAHAFPGMRKAPVQPSQFSGPRVTKYPVSISALACVSMHEEQLLARHIISCAFDGS